jgi:ubiquinol-cytochrome c reductase cytochrome b subunit
MHIAYLHSTGSNNPLGVDSNGDKIPFFPYFLIKDLLGFFLRFLFIIKFFFLFPELFVEHEKFIQAKSLVTPAHIQPE